MLCWGNAQLGARLAVTDAAPLTRVRACRNPEGSIKPAIADLDTDDFQKRVADKLQVRGAAWAPAVRLSSALQGLGRL
jgi:hypothetical protein